MSAHIPNKKLKNAQILNGHFRIIIWTYMMMMMGFHYVITTWLWMSAYTKAHYFKRKNIHPVFKCRDLATHITQSTRSTQWAQTSLVEADHYSHMPTVKILRLGGERLHPQKKKKKKKKKVLDHYLHHNLVMLLPLWCFLLIYFCSFTHRRRSPRHSNLIEHCIF